MATSEKQSGTLKVPEGQIAYTYHPSTPAPSPPKPPIIFLHAGVADQTLWTEQIHYLCERGWDCLSYDLLGFGKSTVAEELIARQRKVKAKTESDGGEVKAKTDAAEGDGEGVDHLQHMHLLITTTLPTLRSDHPAQQSQQPSPTEPEKVILIGLSIGGGLALEFNINHPSLVAGLVVVAGGVREFHFPHTAEKAALFAQEPVLLKQGDVDGLTSLMVRLWGDGPLQAEGRFKKVSASAYEKMLAWNTQICKSEVEGTGGFIVGIKNPELYPPMSHLERLKGMPLAVGWGVFDESSCTAAMKALAEGVKGAEGRGFEAAHMVSSTPDNLSRDNLSQVYQIHVF